MKKLLLPFSLLPMFFALGALSSVAGEYDFADPKGVNTILFFLDSPLEPIMGTASGISGSVAYDAASPAATKGTLEFPASKLTVPNARMTSVMHGEDWLNVDANPTVTFAFEGSAVEDGKMTLSGKMTLAGVTKDFSASAFFTLIEGGAKARGAGEGDLLVVRSNFVVKRSDFGIKADVEGLTAKVAEDIEIKVAIVGYEK